MTGSFTLDIVKPDGDVLSAVVQEVVVPGLLGAFGILPGHAPFLTQIGQGVVKYQVDGRTRSVMIEGGFCEVRPDRVTILAERAERPEDIDVARAKRALDRAREHVTSISVTASEEEMEPARRKLDRAQFRLDVAATRSDA